MPVRVLRIRFRGPGGRIGRRNRRYVSSRRCMRANNFGGRRDDSRRTCVRRARAIVLGTSRSVVGPVAAAFHVARGGGESVIK